MTKNLSAVKRDKISLRNNARNQYYKSTIKTLIKKTLSEIHNMEFKDYEQASLFVSQSYSKIDKAVNKGIVAKNSAARKKSVLANKLKKIKQS